MKAKNTKSRFRRKLISRLLLLFALFCLPNCKLPAGCGPGELPSNPISSNLVAYTLPPSGSIVRISDFTQLQVHFLTPVQTSTFSILDDMRLFTIYDFWGPARFEIETRPLELLVTNHSWPEESCDAAGKNCSVLELTINSEYMTEGFHYRIRILGEEPHDPEQPGERPQTYLTSSIANGGAILKHDVDVVVGLVPDILEDNEGPTISVEHPLQLTWDCDPTQPYQGFNVACYVAPHQRFTFRFSEQAGFVSAFPEPLWGFNFDLHDETFAGETVSVFESDSIQGLDPGTIHNIQFLGLQATPESGIPYTMDRYGNPLSPLSVEYAFKTSHVRITFPFHAPFSEVPDDWYYQLGSTIDNAFVSVEVTPFVYRLSPHGPTGQQAAITFPEENITPQGNDNTFHTLYIDSLPECPDGGCPVSLQVHAYDQEDNWLGADMLTVYAHPQPSPVDRILIASFNAKSHDALCEPIIPEVCDEISWPVVCFELWLEDEPLPSMCTEFPFENFPKWQGYCRDIWLQGLPLPSECDPVDAPWPGYCTEYYSEYFQFSNCSTWRERLDLFVQDVIIPFRPAVIALQEVYLHADCGWDDVCSNCSDISKGVWLGYLMNRIDESLDRYDEKYFIATTSRSGKKDVCFGDETEGEAIIYNPKQVSFLRAKPPQPGANYCEEWYAGQKEHYEAHPSLDPDYPDIFNDCLLKSANDSKVQRAIFEFPVGSKRYFNFYNTHLDSPCEIPETLDYIRQRQDSFDLDLSWYLEPDAAYWTYPPIYAGDMNLSCDDLESGDCKPIVYDIYDNLHAPQEYVPESRECDLDPTVVPFYHMGVVDLVWIGKPYDLLTNSGFVYEEGIHIVTESEREAEYSSGEYQTYCDELEATTPFRCDDDGFRTLNYVYSDHRVVMIEVSAED